MIDYAKARDAMVEGQVRTNDVTDRRIQDAMGAVPRELFVPKGKRPLAYMSEVIEIGENRHLMDPRTFAKLAQAAEITASDVVLDVACGTGYSSAVIAHFCRAVVALETDEALASAANQNFTQLALDNAAVMSRPLEEGCPDQGPFDVIFFSGGVEQIPDCFPAQLKDGGRMVAIVMDERLGRAHVFLKVADVLAERIVFDASLPVLPGFVRKAEFVF